MLSNESTNDSALVADNMYNNILTSPLTEDI